jgi:phage baseplate assembly protein W
MAKDFRGGGWGFPVRPGPDGALALVGQEEAIQRAIRLILGTAPGERLMRPDFGCGIHDLVFQANSAGLRGAVQEKVRSALVKWEPRIDVIDVRADTSADDPAVLLIRIDYRVRDNNAFFNLVYPFFLTEGPG